MPSFSARSFFARLSAPPLSAIKLQPSLQTSGMCPKAVQYRRTSSSVVFSAMLRMYSTRDLEPPRGVRLLLRDEQDHKLIQHVRKIAVSMLAIFAIFY